MYYVLFSLRPEFEFGNVNELLQSHASKKCCMAVIPDERQRIIVRRKHVWNDAKRTLRQPGFNNSIGINVVFIGEDAHDAGGPSREFFRLVLKQISQDGNLFGGQSSSRILVHNVLALQSNEFHIAGHLIALSLLYGGPAPHFFSGSVLSYMMNEPLSTSMIDEITDYDVQSSLHKVCLFILQFNMSPSSLLKPFNTSVQCLTSNYISTPDCTISVTMD